MFLLFDFSSSLFFTIANCILFAFIVLLFCPYVIKNILFDLPIFICKNLWAFIKFYIDAVKKLIFGPSRQELQDAHDFCQMEFMRDNPGERLPDL